MRNRINQYIEIKEIAKELSESLAHQTSKLVGVAISSDDTAPRSFFLSVLLEERQKHLSIPKEYKGLPVHIQIVGSAEFAVA